MSTYTLSQLEDMHGAVLRALAHLREWGWLQFMEYDEDTGAADLRGALIMGSYGEYTESLISKDATSVNLSQEHWNQFRTHLELVSEVKRHIPGIQNFAEYNDAHERTQEDIEDVLLATAHSIERSMTDSRRS